LASGLSHMFHCMSERSYVIWWGVDYVSIVVTVLVGSLVYGRFTFYCLPQQELFFYISLSGLCLSTIMAVLFVTSAGVRNGSFFLYVTFANVLPFAYTIFMKLSHREINSPYAVPNEYLYYWSAMLVLVCLGFVVKGTDIPERCVRKGTVDIIGQSHQFWHILINVGNGMSYLAWHYYLAWRAVTPCPASSFSLLRLNF